MLITRGVHNSSTQVLTDAWWPVMKQRLHWVFGLAHGTPHDCTRERESREQSTMGRHKGLARLNLQMYRVNNSLQCYKSWWSHSKVVWNGDIRAHPSSVLGSVAVWAEILWAAGTNVVQRSTQVARPVTLQRTERDLMQNSFLYFQSKALEARVFAK